MFPIKNPFRKFCDGKTNITSSVFRTVNFPNDDSYMENIEDGTIRIYTIDSITASKVVLIDDVGNVNYDEGKVLINQLQIISGSDTDNNIYITAVPKNDDISAVREVYLNLALSDSTFSMFKEVA